MPNCTWHASCTLWRGELPMTRLESASEGSERSAPTHARPAPASHFDLPQVIDELRRGDQYERTGHAARTLVKCPELRILLIVLRRNAELKEHRTNQPVSIHLLSGHIRVALPEYEETIRGLLVIEPGVAHKVSAVTDSAFLLTMPWSEHTEG
jgi:quercetin dioxygenase-like cupin family protein